jgi:hypothetical protein
VAGGELSAHDAESIKDAAIQAGLPSNEIERTFLSGYQRGLENPSSAPEREANKPRTAIDQAAAPVDFPEAERPPHPADCETADTSSAPERPIKTAQAATTVEGQPDIYDEWEPAIKEWPVMPEADFHGVAGDFARLACHSSEADPAAVTDRPYGSIS